MKSFVALLVNPPLVEYVERNAMTMVFLYWYSLESDCDLDKRRNERMMLTYMERERERESDESPTFSSGFFFLLHFSTIISE